MNGDDVRRRWAERSGEFSPEYYAYRGSDETSESIRVLLDHHVGRESSILELGCSSGRHLAHLYEDGFRDLTGIELNGDALAVMKDAYPDLAIDGTFHVGAIEDLVDSFADGRFDAVYSVETLQHVHPDSAWVFAELARITDTLLITVENEGVDGSGEKRERDDGHRNDSSAPESGQDEGEPAGTDPDESDLGVTHVDEGVPLYYRDWARVFTDLGCTEIETQVGTRDTLRAFGPPSH